MKRNNWEQPQVTLRSPSPSPRDCADEGRWRHNKTVTSKQDGDVITKFSRLRWRASRASRAEAPQKRQICSLLAAIVVKVAWVTRSLENTKKADTANKNWIPLKDSRWLIPKLTHLVRAPVQTRDQNVSSPVGLSVDKKDGNIGIKRRGTLRAQSTNYRCVTSASILHYVIGPQRFFPPKRSHSFGWFLFISFRPKKVKVPKRKHNFSEEHLNNATTNSSEPMQGKTEGAHLQ